MYAMRLLLGDEAFRKAIAQQFLGDAQKALSPLTHEGPRLMMGAILRDSN